MFKNQNLEVFVSSRQEEGNKFSFGVVATSGSYSVEIFQNYTNVSNSSAFLLALLLIEKLEPSEVHINMDAAIYHPVKRIVTLKRNILEVDVEITNLIQKLEKNIKMTYCSNHGNKFSLAKNLLLEMQDIKGPHSKFRVNGKMEEGYSYPTQHYFTKLQKKLYLYIKKGKPSTYKKNYSDEQKKLIIKLRKEGMSLTLIAKQLNLARHRIYYYLRKEGLN